METNIKVRSFDSNLKPEEFRRFRRFPVYTVLENLRSAFNVGSIIRTADCALLETVTFCGITAYPPHRKLDKTALGALPYICWDHHDSAVEVVERMKNEGITVYALELTNRSRVIWDVRFSLPAAVILGNEALGVSQEVLSRVDEIVEIPMLGFKNSINVAVAYGIAVYEIQRQHWQEMDKESWIRMNESGDKNNLLK